MPLSLPSLPDEPVQNWNDLRLQLVWAYAGPIRQYASSVYPGHPIAAWLLRAGRVALDFGSHRETYRAGSWIFPRGEEGHQEFSRDAVVVSIRFVAEWPTGEELFDRTRTRVLPAARFPKLTRIAERLARLVDRAFPDVTHELRHMPGSFLRHVEMQRLFLGWILAYADAMAKAGLAPRSITRLDPRIRQAVHLLESRPLSQPLRERELAQEVGLSVSHLHKLFVETLQATPAGYWERKRLGMAKLALLESQQSAKSIAYGLGFKSLSHFSLWITKRLGRSPRALRRQAQGR